MGFPFPWWVSKLSIPRINSQSVTWWQKLSWCPRWNSPTESTNSIKVLFKWMDVINWWQKLSCRPHGIFPPSCNLQFAPTLTLPSLRSHDKQNKILLHFEMQVCTSCDLFLKSYIFLGLGDQEAARSELRGPQVLGRVHLFGCRQVVFIFKKKEDCWTDVKP